MLSESFLQKMCILCINLIDITEDNMVIYMLVWAVLQPEFQMYFLGKEKQDAYN